MLLLDVMGTLVHDPFYVEVPAFFGMTLDELIAAKHPSAWAEFERGAIDEAALRARFFRDGRAFDLAGLKACMQRHFTLLEGVEALLADLAARRVEMHALSNYSPWWRLIDASTGLSRFLDWTFVSCDTGVRKPDPRAYEGALETLGARASDVVFVDDREENCTAARELGIDAIRFENVAGLRAELAQRGLL